MFQRLCFHAHSPNDCIQKFLFERCTTLPGGKVKFSFLVREAGVDNVAFTLYGPNLDSDRAASDVDP